MSQRVHAEWDAGLGVKLILPGCWLHLSFRGHFPYRFRSDNGSCSEPAPELMFDNFQPIPDAESLPFYPLVLKLVECVPRQLHGWKNSKSCHHVDMRF